MDYTIEVWTAGRAHMAECCGGYLMIAAVLATCIIFGVFIPWARQMDNMIDLHNERQDSE